MQQKLLDEIETLNANDESIERLAEELASFARHYQEKARELSDLRHQAATGLASAVEQEIQRLGMPGGRFTIELHANTSNELLPNGLEQVELLVSANPGQPLKALAKVASGVSCHESAWRSRSLLPRPHAYRHWYSMKWMWGSAARQQKLSASYYDAWVTEAKC